MLPNNVLNPAAMSNLGMMCRFNLPQSAGLWCSQLEFSPSARAVWNQGEFSIWFGCKDWRKTEITFH